MKKLFILFIALNLFSSLFAIQSQAVEDNYTLISQTKLSNFQLERIAEHGDAQAQYDLAIYYLSNKGSSNLVSGNSTGNNKYEVAEYWLEKSATQGHIEAQYRLAWRYFSRRNFEEAVKWLQKASIQGHIEAQNDLKLKWARDLLKEQKQRPAKKLSEIQKLKKLEALEKLAEQGDAQAQYELALYYNSPYRRHYNTDAKSLFEKSALQGHKEAQYEWATILEDSKNIKEAFKWYLKAALQGNGMALISLRSFIESEWVKIEPNQKEKKEIVELINKLAEQGKAWAQYQLATIELSKQNFEKAKEWLEKASLQNYAEAQYQLAQVEFKQGNFEKAKEWLEKASLQKHFASKVKLAWMYFFGQGVKENREKALFLMRKVAFSVTLRENSPTYNHIESVIFPDDWIEIEKSYVSAPGKIFYELAVMLYHEGYIEEATTNMKIAAKKGYAQAKESLSFMRRKLKPEKIPNIGSCRTIFII